MAHPPSSRPSGHRKPSLLAMVSGLLPTPDAHAQAVHQNALRLFKSMAPLYDMTRRDGELLGAAALLHDLGGYGNPEHQVRSRDLILAAAAGARQPGDVTFVAWLAFLHGGWAAGRPLKAAVREAAAAVPRSQRSSMNRLAAILRVADGLDYSRTGSQVVSVACRRKAVTLAIAGPHAAQDAARALRKADLWGRVFKEELVACTGEDEAGAASASDDSLVVALDDSMECAALKLLLHQFDLLRKRQRKTRRQPDTEHVHAARVAAMRMRSVLEVFPECLDAKRAEPLERHLKRLRHYLGAVRNLDVLADDLQARFSDMTQARCLEAQDAQRMVEAFTAKRARAAELLRDHLQSKGFRSERKALARQLQRALRRVKAAAAGRRQLRVWLPVLIHERIACLRELGQVIECGAPGQKANPHSLRLEVKRFRYLLEFFQAQLGHVCALLVEESRKLQDSLGGVQDLRTERQMLDRLHLPEKVDGADAAVAALESALQCQAEVGLEHWRQFQHMVLRPDRIAVLLEPLFAAPAG